MALKRTKRWFRIFKIGFIMSQEGLDDITFSTPMLKTFHFLTWLNPFWFSYRKKDRGQRIRNALERLGPIFVKFGQILSTRQDMIPPDIIKELCKLQDNVPPFDANEAKKIIEKALNQKIDEAFDDFSLKELASASIAQVHSAKLKDGREVIIKVLRPNVKNVMEKDLEILEAMAKGAERFNKLARKMNILALVKEAKTHMLNELNLMREAASACQLRRNFKDHKFFYVPEIYWPYCRENVMVMERISGIQIHNVNALKAKNIDMKVLAERGIEIFYTQVFRDCFFHADMHPGNLFVNTKNPKKPSYIAVDFGVMGSLNKEDQYYLAANFLAFFQRDYYKVAKLHVDSGWVAHDTSIEEFEAAIRTICEPIFEKPLKEISFGQTLVSLFQIAQKFEMHIQPQLLLLQKTLLNIEGLARSLFPDLDLWKIAKPFLEDWMKKQVGLKSIWYRSKENFPFISANFPEVPIMIYEILKHTHEQQVNLIEKDAKKRIEAKQPKRKRNWLSRLIAVAGGIIIIVGGALSIDMSALSHTKDWLIARPGFISLIGVLILALGWFTKSRK